MLYNREKKRVMQSSDCITCKYFDKYNKRCNNGIGKNCFEYDKITQVVIDPITKLPIRFEEE